MREFALDLGDHAESPVAADRGAEEPGVLRTRELERLAPSRHQLQRPHGVHHGTAPDVPPVAVHRDGAADGEVTEALHDLHRQITGIDPVLHVPPAHPGLDPDHPAPRIEEHGLVHRAHVQVQRPGLGDLAALAVAPAAD
jgi:hypothetical protein